MAWWAKYLASKCEDLNLNPCNPSKSQAQQHLSVILTAKLKSETGESSKSVSQLI